MGHWIFMCLRSGTKPFKFFGQFLAQYQRFECHYYSTTSEEETDFHVIWLQRKGSGAERPNRTFYINDKNSQVLFSVCVGRVSVKQRSQNKQLDYEQTTP